MSEPVHTSETPATVAPEPSTPPAESQTEEVIPGAEHLGDPGKQALERMKAERDEARRTAAAHADAARRLKEIEDRDLSELERERRDREEAAMENTTLKTELARLRVAVAKGLPADIAATLSGSNEEELAAHADRLIAWRGNVPPTSPRPDPGQGPRPSTPLAEEEAEYARFFPQG